MASIRYDSDLPRKAEVLTIARLSSRTPREVTGCLLEFWSWAADQGGDGFLAGFTLDDLPGVVPGTAGSFWPHVAAVGWITQREDGVEIADPKRSLGRWAEPAPRSAAAGEYGADFLAFWGQYPRRVGKPSAWRAWKASAARGHSPAAIMAGLGPWLSHWRGRDEAFIPHPATFLNDDRWQASPPSPAPGGREGAVETGSELSRRIREARQREDSR